jgi:hypothetical protein
LRVFHQVKQWIGEFDNMEAKDWGWSIEHNMCVPIRSSLPPAPDELLKTIYCRCKTNCDSKRCNCRKHGLECSVACTECRGNTCSNMSAFHLMKHSQNMKVCSVWRRKQKRCHQLSRNNSSACN